MPNIVPVMWLVAIDFKVKKQGPHLLARATLASMMCHGGFSENVAIKT